MPGKTPCGLCGMTMEKAVKKASIPVTVSLQIHHPEETGFLRIDGTLEIAEGLIPSLNLGTQTRPAHHPVVARMQRIWDWEREHFPHWTPKISHELFRMLGQEASDGKAYTVKEIVHVTGFSERAIRKQLDRFEAHGWITRGRNHLDRRNCHIQPTDGLMTAYQEWLTLHITL